MAEKTDIPGKEGHRSNHIKSQIAAELSEYLKCSVKNVLRQVPDDKFVFLYKSLFKEYEKKDEIDRPSLCGSSSEGRKYHSQFNDMIIRSTSRTVDETVLNMDNKLKELEELKSSQTNTDIQWRPPGNAYEHMKPFEVISEMKKKKELEGKIEREQESLNILKTRLNKRRNKAEELNEQLLGLIEEIQNVVTSKTDEGELQRAI